MNSSASTSDSAPSIPQEPFAGAFCREGELEQLVSLISRSLRPGLPSDRPGESPLATSLVLLRGGSGMGKSLIFREAQHRSRELGIRVRETFCYERQGIPFLPILRLVKELIEESGERQELWRRYAYVLARVFPELTEDLGGGEAPIELPGENGKIQFFDALTSIIGEISREEPLLLVVHDLHRSDRGTVEFLEYLARNAHLEVIGRRPDAVPLEDGDEARAWREIRSREGRRGEYLGEGIPGEDRAGPEVGCRWLVLANYRGAGPVEDSRVPSVVAAIEALGQQPYAAQLELTPLGEDEVGAIAMRLLGGNRLPATSARHLASVTGGNPLHVVEVCRTIHEGDDPDELLEELDATVVRAVGPAEAEAEEVAREAVVAGGDPPEPVIAGEIDREGRMTRLVRRRLDRLEAGPRAIVDVLATLRRPTPTATLEAILDRDSASLSVDLATLHEAGFVKTVESNGSERSILTHEDHTRWAYDALTDDVRRSLHGRVGRFLAEQERAHEPVRAFEIYEHLRSGENAREAVAFGLTAARYFARAYAGELAVVILRELLPMLGSTEDEPLRTDLLLELAIVEAEHADLPTAKFHVKEYIENEGLSAPRRVEAVLLLADLYRRLDEPLKGLKSLNRLSREVISEAGGLSAVRISEMQSRLRLQRQDPKRAIGLCLRGLQELETAETAGVPGIADQQSRLQEVLADAHRARGDVVSAIHGYQTLLEQVEVHGDDVRLSRVLRTLGRVYYDRGNHFRGARYLFRALEGIARTQDVCALGDTYDLLGKVYRNSGDFLRSLEYFRRSLHLRERIGDKEGLGPTLNSIGSLYAHNGDYERAIRYFKRSVSNSERYGSTAGIVRAFLHLGWVYHDLGERKQVESLAKQILILAQEFNLNELEGEGHRLLGNLHFLRGAWKECERAFRRALEIAQRRGLGKLEAASHLDLGMLLAEREEVDGALKRISKGLLLAEELQAIPHQVRGQQLKGNIARQLKGGTTERALESYRRGLELVAGGTLLPLRFELEAAMARTYQSNLEFELARECYFRAEQILEQISVGLPEDMRVVYHDDRRRKNFLDDLQRFQKEASGRPAPVPALSAGPPGRSLARALPPPTGTAASEASLAGVLSALEGLATARTVKEWARSLLAEARRLVPAPRGFLWESTGSGGRPLAQSDMGAEEEWASPERLPRNLALAAIEAGRSLRSSEDGWEDLVSGLVEEGPLRSRSVTVIPIVRPSVFQGALFLERPSAGNPFTESEVTQLEQLLSLARGQLTALAEVRQLRCFEGTPILTAAGFDLELERQVQRLQEGGGELGAIEIIVPGLDLLVRSRGDDAPVDALLGCLGPEESTAIRVGGDHYLFLFHGVGIEMLRSRRESVSAELSELRKHHGLPEHREITVRVSSIAAGNPEAIDLLKVYGAQFFREGELGIDSEISQLTGAGLTLKEAKIALEKSYITSELYRSGGNITRAAESLGVHRPQLSTLIKKHGVRREDFELGH